MDIVMFYAPVGLIRLQQLFQAVNLREQTTLDIDVKRITDPQQGYEMLKSLHKKSEDTRIRVFLDIPTERAEELIVKLVQLSCKCSKARFC